jgi:hypothetical protein
MLERCAASRPHDPVPLLVDNSRVHAHQAITLPVTIIAEMIPEICGSKVPFAKLFLGPKDLFLSAGAPGRTPQSRIRPGTPRSTPFTNVGQRRMHNEPASGPPGYRPLHGGGRSTPGRRPTRRPRAQQAETAAPVVPPSPAGQPGRFGARPTIVVAVSALSHRALGL